MPTEWKTGMLVTLPKKGNLSECKNWRGIMLLSVPSKIFCRIILDRIKETVDKKLRKEQAGFRKDKSCTDHVATLRIIVEQCIAILRPVWLSSQLSINTKIRIFNTNVKPVLLYGCETWKTTQSLTNKLQVFINCRLRYILKVWWPNKISNKELWKKTKQEEISTTIKRRKWSWIGHTLRKDPTNTTKQALEYNPQGKRRQGRPKINWRRSKLQDLDKVGVTGKRPNI